MQKQPNARVTHSTTQTNILHRDKKAKLVVVALVVMA
jgi:hypothetical protein